MALIRTNIIVALDGMDFMAAINLIEELEDVSGIWGFKLNDLFYHPYAPILLKRKKKTNFFVDVKLHDIPNTVKNTTERLVKEFSPAIITVHASGGVEMMKAAVKAADSQTEIIAVTVLTSLGSEECKKIYSSGVVECQVQDFIKMAKEAGVDGIVCSPLEVKAAKEFGLFTVVPGIRPTKYTDKGDQKRVGSPRQALKDGADLLVIGRAITQAQFPVQAVKDIIDEMYYEGDDEDEK